eukprot:6491206-Amphidinium_carterae.3
MALIPWPRRCGKPSRAHELRPSCNTCLSLRVRLHPVSDLQDELNFCCSRLARSRGCKRRVRLRGNLAGAPVRRSSTRRPNRPAELRELPASTPAGKAIFSGAKMHQQWCVQGGASLRLPLVLRGSLVNRDREPSMRVDCSEYGACIEPIIYECFLAYVGFGPI